MIKTCPVCLVEFKARRSKINYCSRVCSNKARGIRNRANRKLNCLHCNKEFQSYPNWIKRGGGKFCSTKCHGLYKRTKVETKCIKCGIEFLTKPSNLKYGRAKYCSAFCASQSKIGIKRPLGSKSRTWKGGITLISNYCTKCGVRIEYRATQCKSCSKVRDNHPNWKGIGHIRQYPKEWNEDLKNMIRERDMNTCAICSMEDVEHIIVYGRNMHVHHIDYKKSNLSPDNLITLCAGCHVRTNYNRSYWTGFFTNKLSKKDETCLNL